MIKTCIYCNEKFETNINIKKYCCYDHRDKSNNLIKRVELASLTNEEKEFRKKLLERIKNER